MHSLHPCARVPTHLIAYLVNMSHTFPLLSRAAVLLLAAGALTSCLNDDTKTENLTSDCVVTSFNIGNLDRKIYLRTKDNRRDSVTTVEVKGSLYRFTIDQQRGLIYNIDLADDGLLEIDMTLTAPNCPAADFIMEDVRIKSAGVPGVKDVRVNLVFEPEWDREMMSEEAKLDLGFL